MTTAPTTLREAGSAMASPERAGLVTCYMLVFNTCAHDSRVLREAKTLAAAGHRVTIVALAEAGLPETEYRDGFRIVRIPRPSWAAFELARLYRLLAGHIAWLFKRVSGSGKVGSEALGLRSNGRFSLARVLICNVAYGWRVWKASRAEKAEVFHAHDLTTLPVACLIALLTKARVVYDSHELFLESSHFASLKGWRKWFLKSAERYLAQRVSAIITVNESIATELTQRYGVKRPVVVMNCCEYTALTPQSNLRRKLGLSREARLVLYVGAFSPSRGLPELLRSSPYLDDDVQIVLIGYGSLRDALCDQVRRDGLGGRVHIFGPVGPDEVIAYAAGADVAVAAIQGTTLNHYYCTPNKVFEYLMAGLPVVASRLPEMAQIVTDYGVGDLCDPTDPQDIARAISGVLDSPDHAEMARRARQIAEDRYNWEMESQKLLAVYDSLS